LEEKRVAVFRPEVRQNKKVKHFRYSKESGKHLMHAAQQCAAVLRQRHAPNQRAKAPQANLKNRDML